LPMAMRKFSQSSPHFKIRLLIVICTLSVLLNVSLIVRYGVGRSLVTRVRLAYRVAPPVNGDDHVRGNANAINTIIEYTDYQCRYCRLLHAELKKLVTTSGNTRWVIRHKPMVDMHPLALKAAIAAECAGKQNAFWQYSDGLFEHQESLSEPLFGELARECGLNIAEFNACESGDVPNAVRKGVSEAAFLEIDGTPTLFINGQRFRGLVPYSLLTASVR
jgi:protein-disulfide isomerase